MVKIVTQNVRGLRNYEKRKSVIYFLKQKADVICLQETHSEKDDEQRWEIEFGGDIYWSHGTTASKGVAILIKRGTDIEVL